MKSRWLVNLGLLVLIAGLALFLYLNPREEKATANEVKVSELSQADIRKVAIEFPAKKPVVLEKREGNWFIVQPYPARAGEQAVNKILAVLNADSIDKFDTSDLARFGLDNPSLRLKLDDKEFLFGTFNPVNGQQYVAFGDSVYLISTAYSDAAATQVVELLDKRLLAPGEHIAAFDFSRLEQWEATGLRLEHNNGQWKVSIPDAKPVRSELDEWFGDGWKTLSATSVEPYKPDHKTDYPSFEIILKDGKRIRVEKHLESPEMILARPDEGMLYHFPADLGFSLLNPPVGAPK
jgi:hypothetical protein